LSGARFSTETFGPDSSRRSRFVHIGALNIKGGAGDGARLALRAVQREAVARPAAGPAAAVCVDERSVHRDA